MTTLVPIPPPPLPTPPSPETLDLSELYRYFLSNFYFEPSHKTGKYFARTIRWIVWLDLVFSVASYVVNDDDEATLIAMGDGCYYLIGGLTPIRSYVLLSLVSYRLVGVWFVTHQLSHDFRWLTEKETILSHNEQFSLRLDLTAEKARIYRNRNGLLALSAGHCVFIFCYEIYVRSSAVLINWTFLVQATRTAMAYSMHTYLTGVVIVNYYHFNSVTLTMLRQVAAHLTVLRLAANLSQALAALLDQFCFVSTTFHQIANFQEAAFLVLTTEALGFCFNAYLMSRLEVATMAHKIFGFFFGVVLVASLVKITRWASEPGELQVEMSERLYRDFGLPNWKASRRLKNHQQIMTLFFTLQRESFGVVVFGNAVHLRTLITIFSIFFTLISVVTKEIH